MAVALPPTSIVDSLGSAAMLKDTVGLAVMTKSLDAVKVQAQALFSSLPVPAQTPSFLSHLGQRVDFRA